MTAQRQMWRLGIVSSGALIFGIAGSGAGFADDLTCANNNRGGMLTTTTGELCRTLDTATSGVRTMADGATGGATTGLTAGARTAVGRTGEAANSTAARIDGTRRAPDAPGRSGGKRSTRPARSHDSVHRGPGSVGRTLADAPQITGLPAARSFGGVQSPPKVRLPRVALAPQEARMSGAEPDGIGGLGWVVLAAAGSGLAGLVGGGHIGLLAARRRSG